MIEITREIDGAPDFELGLPRTRPIQFEVTWPQEGEATGLALVIAGFGDDTAAGYSQALRRHIVETTGMGAVSVRYHAFHARPNNGASVVIDPRSHLSLVGEAAMRGVPIPDGADLRSLAKRLVAAGANATARVTLEPAHDERQNFGVLQALDHLCVIGDLIENAPPFDTRRIVVLGSSHGGYIGHLMAKFAPSTLAAIIDNSSYVQPPMCYLGIGDLPEMVIDMEGLKFYGQVRSAWTVSERGAPNFYDRDRDLIRDVGYLPHASTMRAAATDAGAHYFMVNASHDAVSPPDAKRRQQAVLKRAGFESELSIITPHDIDGELFKAHTHGLDCSLKRLFDRYIGRVCPRETAPDGVLGTTIVYECIDRDYRFQHSAQAPYVHAEVYDRFADQLEEQAVAA
jgi:hypothetical protein